MDQLLESNGIVLPNIFQTIIVVRAHRKAELFIDLAIVLPDTRCACITHISLIDPVAAMKTAWTAGVVAHLKHLLMHIQSSVTAIGAVKKWPFAI